MDDQIKNIITKINEIPKEIEPDPKFLENINKYGSIVVGFNKIFNKYGLHRTIKSNQIGALYFNNK